MEFIKKALYFLFYILQVTLILLYLILEELVWDRFAKPIFKYIKYLKPFEKLEQLLKKTNRYVILLIFIVSLVVGEGFGILSPVIAIKGYPTLAIIVYGLKLIIAAFAFWILNTQKEALLSFKWFAYAYNKTMYAINWIKSTKAYKNAIDTISKIKLYIKLKYIDLKNYILNRFYR